MARSGGSSFIGVDVCLDGVKLAQFDLRGESTRMKATASFKLPQSAETLEAEYEQAFRDGVKSIIASKQFAGRDAIATLPSDMVDVRTLTLPGADDELRKMLRWEAESYLSYDIEDAIVDHVVLGHTTAGNERRTEVLVAAARRDTVERFLRIARNAGLTVRAVDIVPTALCRLMCSQCEKDDGPVAVVDIGRTTTTAAIVAGGELRLARQIPQGGSRLTRLVSQGLDMSLEDAEALKKEHGLGGDAHADLNLEDRGISGEPILEDVPGGMVVISQDKITSVIRNLTRPAVEQLAEEAQKLLRYFAMQSHGASIRRVMLTGGGALLKGLDTFLGRHLGLETETMRDVSILPGIEPGADAPPSFAVAAGLALRH